MKAAGKVGTKGPTVKLCEVAELNPRLAEKLSANTEVSFVPMSALSAETAKVVAEETCSYAEVAKGYTPFASGDVLLAKITPCFENGKIAQAILSKPIGFGSTEFHVIRPRPDKLDARYTHHFLRLERIRVAGERRMTGSGGQRRVPENYLAELAIPLPPLAEQRRIAAVLDKAEALRAHRRAALAQLDSLTQSLFLDLFGDPHLNKREWPVQSLRELGKVKTGGTPPSAKSGMFGGRIPFVTPGDLESNESVKRTVTEEGAAEAETVRAGAALICCIGATIGKMGKASQLSAFNQQINAVEWSSGMDDDFGLAVLRFFKPQIVSWGASTTLPILKKSSFEKISIPVPPLALQREFARRVAAVEKLKAAQRAALAELDALFAALQHRAFRGEL